MNAARWLVEMPLATRYVVGGALVAGSAGCVAGLVIGLVVYAPTAWFATFEVGVPAAIAGAVLGLVIGSVAMLLNRARCRSTTRET